MNNSRLIILIAAVFLLIGVPMLYDGLSPPFELAPAVVGTVLSVSGVGLLYKLLNR